MHVGTYGACGQPLKRKQGSTPVWLGVDPCCVAIYANANRRLLLFSSLIEKAGNDSKRSNHKVAGNTEDKYSLE